MKTFYFGMCWQMYGTQRVEVPDEIKTVEEAKEWVTSHWSEIPLPDGDYVDYSDEPDFENCELD